MPVDTRTVARRVVRFATLGDAVADAEALAAADAAGTLKATGNWTLGQALGHLAYWVNGAFDEVPMRRPPLVLRVLIRLARKKVFYGRLTPGFRFRHLPDGTLGTDVMPTAEGLAKFQAAVARFGREATKPVNPVFGSMTEAEWRALNCRHAELHLSFFSR
jgi:hypothetical protein